MGRAKKEALFVRIYREYRRPLDFYLRTYCADSMTREELLQEVFVKIFRLLSSDAPSKPEKPLIYRIAGNTGIDWLRSRRRRESVNETSFIETGDSRTPNPELKLVRDEEQETVRETVADLKPADRRLIHLYYYEDLRINDIAVITGKPAGTIKYRLHSIRKKLAVRLKSLEEGEE